MVVFSIATKSIFGHLHLVSPLDDAAAAAAAMCFRLLSRKFFDDISLVGLNPLVLPSSDNRPSGLVEGIAPGIEEGGKKLLCIENPDLPLLALSPLRGDWCKLEGC